MRRIGIICDRETGLDLEIIERDDGSVIFFAGATLDGDGACGQSGGLPCYAPASYEGRTLDILLNAGCPGKWNGIVTDNAGTPIIQGPDDPCPGAYVSSTSLHLLNKRGKELPDCSPFKYVDSATVPLVVVPPMIIKGVAGIVMGCLCIVTNTCNKRRVKAVVADRGPRNHLGEISIACANALGIPIGKTYPANGGGALAPTIRYELFPGVPAVVNGIEYPLQPASRRTIQITPRPLLLATLPRRPRKKAIV